LYLLSLSIRLWTGYGFVSLSSHEMAMRCILALRDFFYEGRFLKVGWAKKNTKLLIGEKTKPRYS